MRRERLEPRVPAEEVGRDRSLKDDGEQRGPDGAPGSLDDVEGARRARRLLAREHLERRRHRGHDRAAGADPEHEERRREVGVRRVGADLRVRQRPDDGDRDADDDHEAGADPVGQ